MVNNEESQGDLFEILCESVGCDFISDMAHGKSFCDKAKAALKEQNLESYSLAEITDAICYIYGNEGNFSTKEEAAAFIKNGR